MAGYSPPWPSPAGGYGIGTAAPWSGHHVDHYPLYWPCHSVPSVPPPMTTPPPAAYVALVPPPAAPLVPPPAVTQAAQPPAAAAVTNALQQIEAVETIKEKLVSFFCEQQQQVVKLVSEATKYHSKHQVALQNLAAGKYPGDVPTRVPNCIKQVMQQHGGTEEDLKDFFDVYGQLPRCAAQALETFWLKRYNETRATLLTALSRDALDARLDAAVFAGVRDAQLCAAAKAAAHKIFDTLLSAAQQNVGQLAVQHPSLLADVLALRCDPPYANVDAAHQHASHIVINIDGRLPPNFASAWHAGLDDAYDDACYDDDVHAYLDGGDNHNDYDDGECGDEWCALHGGYDSDDLPGVLEVEITEPAYGDFIGPDAFGNFHNAYDMDDCGPYLMAAPDFGRSSRRSNGGINGAQASQAGSNAPRQSQLRGGKRNGAQRVSRSKPSVPAGVANTQLKHKPERTRPNARQRAARRGHAAA